MPVPLFPVVGSIRPWALPGAPPGWPCIPGSSQVFMANWLLRGKHRLSEICASCWLSPQPGSSTGVILPYTDLVSLHGKVKPLIAQGLLVFQLERS